MFWVDYREPLQPGNLTKYPISRDKMIHQLLIPQFQRHRQLESIKGTEAGVECVTLHQQFGRSELRFSNGENLQLASRDVSSKLAQENVCVLPADGLCSHFDRKRRYQFSYGEPGNSDQVSGSIDDLIDGWCPDFRVVELHQRAGIEEEAGQGSTVPALGDNLSGHRPGNLGKPPPDFLKTGGRLIVL